MLNNPDQFENCISLIRNIFSLQIIFAIQVALRICQENRSFGSPDGVNSIATPGNLFFTRSRLSSCINHTVSGFRLMLATVLLLALALNTNAQTQIFGTSGTFTVPAGVTSTKIECWGGGGAGGGVPNANGRRGGGGAGGSYASSTITGLTPLSAINVVVGAGGTSASAANGGDGGNSSFGLFIIALGGPGGKVGSNSNNDIGAGGNAPNAGNTGGTVNHYGGDGANGSHNGNSDSGGGGGSAGPLGNGGNANGTVAGAAGPGGGSSGAPGITNGDGDGIDATNIGGGGSGARNNNTNPNANRSGGNGFSGLVIVSWIPAGYCSGYAHAVFHEDDVVNADHSLGAPDNLFAILDDLDDHLVVQLNNQLASGETIDVLWRRNDITLADPHVRVDFSIDGANWTNGTFSYTEPSLTWVTKNILLPINTRYIRFWETNEYNIDIDAISYYTPGVSTPTAISISAGTEPTCQLTNGTTTTTYATSATNNTGFNWSLSNALAGSINSTTGVMTWANGFSGSVDIQVTASGCNGPSPQVIHPVTVNPLPTITGSLSVCGVGSTTQLTGSGTATSWVSASPAIATVDNTNGLVTGVATGTSVITYTDNKGCGTTATVTVSPTPTTNMVPICQGGNGGSLTSLTTCPVGATIPSGPKDAGSSTSAPGPGSNTWQNAGNIISPVGGPYATADLTNASPTDYLQGTNYNLSIPGNATIKGITVSINRQSTPIGIKDEELKLIKNGTILVTNKANSTDWPTSMEVATYGGPSDLWGTTWTVAEINDLNFGVSLVVKNQNAAIRTASVDYMQISVTYTLPSTLDWFTVSSGGTKIGSGSPFDPVGVSGSGLTDTNTPSTTTYYAACSTSPGCRTATDFIITSSQLASVSIAAIPSGAICAGTSVTFTATPTNEGAAPTYQWKVNNVNVGSSNPLYSYTPADGDIISCVLISSATCATGSPATSNGVTIAIVPPVGPIIFNMGATSTRYQVAGKVTYTATAINNTGIKYTLDATSSIENIIDENTGEVTYSSAWSGTSIITATVSGCPAQTTATHTVATMKTTIGKTWCFALFTATGALTNTGASQVKGHIGTNVGALTGFPPGILDGEKHVNDAISAQAAIDVVTAYNDLAATPNGVIVSGTELGSGQILTPNVYSLGGALNITGDLILDGQGDPNALFIFKVNGALSTLTGSRIILKNSTSILNVYFQVYGAVVLNAEFAGTLVAKGAITINTGSKLIGRALSVVGAIVINDSELTSNCSPIIGLPDNNKPNFSSLDPFEFCVENIRTLAYDAALTDFIPSVRPDYYTLKAGDLNLDLNPATFVHGTCLPENDLILHWSIRNSADEPIKSVSNVFLTDIIGQVSDYTKAIATKTDIIFQGAVNADVTYKITYWLEDTCGNLSDPKVTTITIKPRPNINKVN